MFLFLFDVNWPVCGSLIVGSHFLPLGILLLITFFSLKPVLIAISVRASALWICIPPSVVFPMIMDSVPFCFRTRWNSWIASCISAKYVNTAFLQFFR